MSKLVKTLEKLPNGMFITDDGFYVIKDGEVLTGSLESLSEPSQELGTINDPPNNNQN